MTPTYLRRIYTWRVPPNWAPRDWREELEAEAIAAAWQAELEFDPTRGVPLEAFVHQRVVTHALRRYRREWTYARRSGIHLECGDCHDGTASATTSIELSESLQNWLQRLAEPQRKLIESLYWDETTEVQLADMLGLTQSGISRRKRRVLDQLRRWMEGLEQEKIEFGKD